MSPIDVDHVIYAVQDLDVAAARLLDAYGLASVPGGRHPGWGTENRIVPLGKGYVELVGVVEGSRDTGSAFSRAVREATSCGDRLVGWAVSTGDIHSVAARLGLEVLAASRLTPGESTLRWRLAGVEQAMSDGAMPFFIEWDVPQELHPARAAAEHTNQPRGIARLEVGAEAQAMSAWLGKDELPVDIEFRGGRGLSGVVIATSRGEIALS